MLRRWQGRAGCDRNCNQYTGDRCPDTWVTSQGDRFKEAKLFQDLDSKHSDRLQPSQVHGMGQNML